MTINIASPFFPPNEIDWLLEENRKILNGDAPLSMGPRVREFEQAFAEYVGTRYGVGTNSCTAALEIAIRCLELNFDDEIIVPVETFIATGSAIVREGAIPVFCDINPQTFCMGVDDVERCLSPKTRAIILVHMGGVISPDVWAIKKICEDRNIVLIEDAAHAHGSIIDGTKAGAIGDIGCFSFYPTKVMTTAEGGMLVCSNDSIYHMANALRNRGRSADVSCETYALLGSNNRMSEFTALMGLSQLRCLDDFVAHRNKIALIYDEILSNSELVDYAVPVLTPPNQRSSYWRYTVILAKGLDREKIKNDMLERSISVDWAYYPPLHLQPYFQTKFNTQDNSFPKAEDLLTRNICLPLHVLILEKDARYVGEVFVQSVKRQMKIS